MRTLLSVVACVALAVSAPACAVGSGAPGSLESSTASPGAAAEPPERGGVQHESTRCAVTPLDTGNPFFCTQTQFPNGIHTIGGELSASTDASYAQSCGGRAVIEFNPPSCGSTVDSSFDWDVHPTNLLSLSPAMCASTYVDYTVWVLSRSTGAWTSASKRVYMTYSSGGCYTPASGVIPNVGGDVETVEITADAYEPLFFPLPGGTGFQQVEVPVGLGFGVLANL